MKRIAFAAAVMLVAGAAAASAGHVVDDPAPVGVCHATGSADDPYVFLVVDKNGYEHGHHRHHDADFFVDATAGGCTGDPAWNATVPGDVADAPEGADAVDNGTVLVDGNGTDAGDPTGDAGTGGATGNGTDGPGNATADGTDAEATQENATEPAAPNVRVRQEAFQDEFQVTLTIIVESTGDAVAQNVSLQDMLPEMYRTWHLAGPDAASCVLDDQELGCWFGDLAPGGSAAIEVSAYTDRMPCGYAKTNTVQAFADGDSESRDDASSASIAARPC